MAGSKPPGFRVSGLMVKMLRALNAKHLGTLEMHSLGVMQMFPILLLGVRILLKGDS